MLTLHTYLRSTASYRVRVALNLKEIKHHQIEYDLKTDMQRREDYLVLNPQGMVPMLEDNGKCITQSMAILEYLEERFPDPAILPANMEHRAWVRSFANIIVSDTHPLNNLRVLKYLGTMVFKEEKILGWYHHWLKECFDALEFMLKKTPDKGFCCLGDEISIADICLVPQIYNARRYSFDMSPYPICLEKENYLLGQKAFEKAKPKAA